MLGANAAHRSKAATFAPHLTQHVGQAEAVFQNAQTGAGTSLQRGTAWGPFFERKTRKNAPPWRAAQA